MWVLLMSALASKTLISLGMTMSHKIKSAVPQQWEAAGAVVSVGNSGFFPF